MAAAETSSSTNNVNGEHNVESIITRTITPAPVFNIHEYFQPVFDELDKLNKRFDSIIEEEDNRAREKKK